MGKRSTSSPRECRELEKIPLESLALRAGQGLNKDLFGTEQKALADRAPFREKGRCGFL
jgi:hypothetical protein